MLPWVLFFGFLLAPGTAFALDPDEQRQFADGLYVRGMYDMALDEYLVISREAPDYEQIDMVLFRIAECHRRLDRPDEADRFYARLIREHPEGAYRFRAEFRRAELQITAGRFMEGLNQFRALLDRDPPGEIAASAWFYRGYAAKRLTLEDEAITALDRVREAYPESDFASYAALELAELYRDLEAEPEQRIALYRQAADQPATAAVGAEALFRLGEAAFRRRDFEESAHAYARLLERYPEAPRAREARLQAAWSFHNAGRYADGLELAERVLAGDDDPERRPEWLYVLANCQRRLLRPDDARDTYARIIREHAGHELVPAASYETALISFRQEDYEEAVLRAEQVEPAEEIEQDLYWLLAESYAALARDDAAESYYRRILDAFPDSDRAPEAQHRLARLLQNGGDYEGASGLYRALAGAHPEHALAAPALFASAHSMAMAERFEDALRDWEAVIESHPEHELAEESMIQKALTLIQVDRHDEALTALGAFLDTYPASEFAAEAEYRRGLLLERAGRYADAERSLRAALEREPGRDLTERAQFRLARVLQRQDKEEEAAGLLLGLLDTPARAAMPAALLEWLAIHQLEAGAFDPAARAAEVLVEAGDSAAWRQIGWSLAGRAHERLDRRERAVAAYEQSVNEDARTRDGAEAALALGHLHLEAGAYEPARAQLARAAEWAAEPALADIRARSYFGLGRVAAAREDWDAAARHFMGVGILYDDPELVPESLYRAADAFAILGRDREREQTLDELRERYPDSEWAGESVISE